MKPATYLTALRSVADVLVPPAVYGDFKVDGRFDGFAHIIQLVRRGWGDWHVSIDPIVVCDPHIPESGACLIECASIEGACDSVRALVEAARTLGQSTLVIGFIPDHASIGRGQHTGGAA